MEWAKLRSYYREKQIETDEEREYHSAWHSEPGQAEDCFVSCVLAAARWAIAELHWRQIAITKPEIRAEHADLLKGLNDLHHKLRNLSPDFDRLLGSNADPLGCADSIKELINHAEGAGQRIDKLPGTERPVEAEHRVMLEMAIRVLPVLKDSNIPAAATAGSYLRMLDIGNNNGSRIEDTARYLSDAVEILKAIGDDIGLVRSPETWRDTIIEAKGKTPNLQ